MRNHYRAVVIGGGVVGASVLYHLAKLGWSDIALIERKELTAGSTWHAAGGFHPLNNDLNISSLQTYTINLYEEIQRESGQDIGAVRSGGIMLAASAARWEHLKYMRTIFQTMEIEPELITPSQIKDMFPLMDTSDLHGGLLHEYEGHLDPHSTTMAYAKAAQLRGAEIIVRNQVLELNYRPQGAWDVITEHGAIVAEHVVNAGGLWARKVGRMAGVDLPVTPMQHHYLVTEDIPEIVARDEGLISILDLDGFTYLRQERNGLLMGVYELNPKIWNLEGAPWDYGMELIPEEIDRIAPQLSKGFARYPMLEKVGIKRWVNGAFTFTPDGNPLVGPVPDLHNYWVACGVMAGFSQGGGVGLSLAQWMVHGEPGADVFGMDVARYGQFASEPGYLADTARQFYARRFVLTYPNEELPAGRPLVTSPIYDNLKQQDAVFGCLWDLEVPLFFAPGQPDFQETPTLKRSNAFDLIGQEVAAVRRAVGIVDITGFSRYEVTGTGSEKWLNNILACRLPSVGRIRLAPMLAPSGRLMGDLTVMRLGQDRFWLLGSYYLQSWHMRWFLHHLPENGVKIRNLCREISGISIAGPNSRKLLEDLLQSKLSNADFSFLRCGEFEFDGVKAVIGRISVTGELGYEISVPAEHQELLYRRLVESGADHDLKPFGFRAMTSLRFEKGYGAWSREFTCAYTPAMAGLDRFVDFDKPTFIGRQAAMDQRETKPEQRLVLLEVDSTDADVTQFEPVWGEGCRVGFITSGCYGHWVNKSLGMAYIDIASLNETTQYSVDVVGKRVSARVLPEVPYDSSGVVLRN
ncbi:MAG: FAD-dependent oxidoreductase [Acidiferrobacterales bacterium]|nr:FAD-dependent oxidoreductase [Acidiferrobacterales bacterium]